MQKTNLICQCGRHKYRLLNGTVACVALDCRKEEKRLTKPLQILK